MNILAELPTIVASALGNTLFKTITFQRHAKTSDGRGGFTTARSAFTGQGVITEFSDRYRELNAIPEDRRQLIVQGQGLTTIPGPDDMAAIDGTSWRIFKVNRVPSDAVYMCEVGPDDGTWDIDLSTTITADPELLASLTDVVADAASAVFGTINYYRQTGATSDGRGSFGRPKQLVQVTGIITELQDIRPSVGNLPVNERVAIIQNKDLTFTPIPGDVLGDGDGLFWVVNRIDIVPGKAVYQLKCSPTSSDAAQQTTITGDADVIMDVFTVSASGGTPVVSGAGAGAVSDFTVAANGTLLIEGQMNVTLLAFLSADALLLIEGVGNVAVDDFTVNGQTSKTEQGSLSASVSDFALSAQGDSPISAQAALNLDAFTAFGGGSQDTAGSLISQLDDFTSAGDANLSIEGALSATLDSFTGAGDGDPLIQGTGSGTVAFTASGSATLTIEGTAAPAVDPFTVSGAADLNIEGTTAGTLDDFTSTGQSAQGLSGTLSETLDGFTLAASGAHVIEGTADLTIDNFTSVGASHTSISGSLTDTVSMSLSAAGDPIIEGDLSETMAAFSVSADGTLGAAPGGIEVVWSLSQTGGGSMDWTAEDVAVGDVIVMFTTGGFGTAPPDFITADGFTEIYDTGNSKMSVSVGFREVTSGNLSDTVMTSENSKANIIALCLRGVDLTSLGTINNSYRNGSCPTNPSSITSPADSAIILVAAEEQRDNQNPTPSTGYTLLESVYHSAGGNQHTTTMAYKIASGTGTEDPDAYSGGSSGAQARSLTFAFEPA